MVANNREITCSRCGRVATITAIDCTLCIDCWREVRLENRKKRQKESLDKCFAYKSRYKMTEREAAIVNDIMIELEKRKPKGL